MEEWKLIHSLPFSETKDTKILTLQYRFIHRIYYTNSLLMKCKLIEHEECTFCSASKESLMHVLWECTHIQNIWSCLLQSIKNKYGIDIERSPKHFIFGFYKSSPLSGLNMIILLIKKYITLSRQYKVLPSWESCLIYLKNYRKVDYRCMYSLSPNAAKKLKEKWESINLILNWFSLSF